MYVPSNDRYAIPLMLVATADRLEAVSALKLDMADKVMKALSSSSAPPSSSSSSFSSSSDVLLVELSPSGRSISRIVDDADRVGSLRENVTLAAYDVQRTDAMDATLVLLQVSQIDYTHFLTPTSYLHPNLKPARVRARGTDR